MTRTGAKHVAAMCLVIFAGLWQPLQAEGQGQRRALGRGAGTPGQRQAVRAELPADASAVTGQVAADAVNGALGQKVRDRGGDPAQVAELLAADPSVWIDHDGQLAFLDVAEAADAPLEPETLAAAASVPAPAPIRLEANGLPIHHSKPGAARTLYVDLTPQAIPVRNEWRPFLGRSLSVINTRGLSLDGDALTFTAEEQAVVSRLWGRVAEDWAPFDIDVTTERPATFDGRVLWSIVTRGASELGFSNQSLAGIAFTFALCSPSGAFGPQTPAFTFWDIWGAANHSDIADTVSHEAGHIAGLVHDGALGGFSYYGGLGSGATSWGPIMGGPLTRNLTQWSRGEYPGATNFNVCGPGFQDDIAHLGSRIGLRPDDVSDTIAGATPLAVPATGIIGTTSDIDVFALPRATEVRIDVTPFRAGEQTDGGNLDVAAEIVNGAGLVVASIDDVHETAATLSATLPAGPHYLRVRASFDPDTYPIYGSLGQYTVTGTFRNVISFTGFEAPLPAEALNAGRTVPVKFSLTDAVAGARVQLWSDASPLAAAVLAESECRAQQHFRQHCTLKVPKALPAGAYWIVAQYQDVDGTWVTAQVDATSSTPNPLAVVTR